MKHILIRTTLLLMAAAVVVLAIRSDQQGRHDALRARAIGCLGQAHLAVSNYEARTGKLPPICVRDADGTPLLSWRALVLPELDGGDEVLSRLDLSAPWNSHRNREVIVATGDSLSAYFTREERPYGYVCVFAFVGDQSRWSSESNARADKKRGQTGDRILLLYVPSKHVELLQPVEITEVELRALIDDGQEALFVSDERTYGTVRVVDGNLRFDGTR